MSPLNMNLGKGIVAGSCLFILVCIDGFSSMNTLSIFLLGLSGLLGITLGDTFFFSALPHLGAAATVITTMLIPATAVVLSVVLLHEAIGLETLIGVVITFIGVMLVMHRRETRDVSRKHSQKIGLRYAAVAIMCCAFAIILSKIALRDIPALQAAFIRQAAGLTGLFVWGCFTLQMKPFIACVTNRAILARLGIIAFFSTFLGTWFSLIALQKTTVTLAATLNATSPLFVLPMASVILREKITSRMITGAFLTVAGIVLLLWKGR